MPKLDSLKKSYPYLASLSRPTRSQCSLPASMHPKARCLYFTLNIYAKPPQHLSSSAIPSWVNLKSTVRSVGLRCWTVVVCEDSTLFRRCRYVISNVFRRRNDLLPEPHECFGGRKCRNIYWEPGDDPKHAEVSYSTYLVKLNAINPRQLQEKTSRRDSKSHPVNSAKTSSQLP